jgi:hypothetical protein
MNIFVKKFFPLVWFAVIAVVLWLLWGLEIVHASGDECRYNCDDDTPTQADANADAAAEADADAESLSDAEAFATNELSITHQRRAPNIYLYPANQVEACGRTFGISGANTSGGWALGVPIPRSWTPTCDLWKAANEAQENGHIYTSYMFTCSIKAIRKVWGESTCLEFDRMAQTELFAMIAEAPAPAPPAMSDLYNQAAQSSEYFLAQVAAEDYERDKEIADEQHELQQNKIDSLEQNEAELRREVERLREAAAAKAAEDEARRIALGEALKNYQVVKENDT